MGGHRLAAIERRVLATITDSSGTEGVSGAAASLMDVAVSWDAVAGFTDSIQCVPKSTSPFSSPYESTVLSHTEVLNFMIYLVVNECPGVSEYLLLTPCVNYIIISMFKHPLDCFVFPSVSSILLSQTYHITVSRSIHSSIYSFIHTLLFKRI